MLQICPQTFSSISKTVSFIEEKPKNVVKIGEGAGEGAHFGPPGGATQSFLRHDA